MGYCGALSLKVSRANQPQVVPFSFSMAAVLSGPQKVEFHFPHFGKRTEEVQEVKNYGKNL
jgi:hypothetical protein